MLHLQSVQHALENLAVILVNEVSTNSTDVHKPVQNHHNFLISKFSIVNSPGIFFFSLSYSMTVLLWFSILIL